MRWTTLRTLTTENTQVRIEWTYDEDYENDVQDEHGNTCAVTQAKIATGEWTAFGFRVVVYVNGVLMGEDSLWGSLHPSPEDALEEHIGGYLSGMLGQACNEARRALVHMPRLRPHS